MICVLSAQDNESLRWRLIQMNVIVVWFYLLRLRDSGIWNRHLQQKLDDTELVFLIIKWYMCGICPSCVPRLIACAEARTRKGMRPYPPLWK